MTRRAPLGVVLLSLLSLLLGGCSQFNNSAEKLDRAVAHFNEGVRWQRWETAAGYLPADERADFVREREAEAGVFRVTDFEVRNVRHDPAGDKAYVTLEFAWHRYPSLTIHRTRVKQTWEYRKGAWLRTAQEEVEEPEEKPEPKKGLF